MQCTGRRHHMPLMGTTATHTHTHTPVNNPPQPQTTARTHSPANTPPSRSGGEGGCQHHGSGGDGRREWRRWEEEGGEAGMLKGEAEGGRQLGDFSEDGTSHFAPSLTLLPPASPPHPAAQADGVVRVQCAWRRGGGGRLNGGVPQRQQEGPFALTGRGSSHRTPRALSLSHCLT